MSSNYKQALDLVEQLSQYLQYEDMNERSECLELLAGLVHYPDYVDDELYCQIVKQLEQELEYYKNNTEIVEREQTETITRTVSELVWKNE